MKHIEVPGRLVFNEVEYYTPNDGEIIKLSMGDSSMCVKAIRRHDNDPCCERCVFIDKLCTTIPLKCTYHYYIDPLSLLEDL